MSLNFCVSFPVCLSVLLSLSKKLYELVLPVMQIMWAYNLIAFLFLFIIVIGLLLLCLWIVLAHVWQIFLE